MTLASFALSVALAALVGLLALTAWQNRDIASRLRGTGRPPARVLGVALRLWSPVALAIVLATLAVQGLGSLATSIVYRATPLEAWCVVENAEGRPMVPCTDLPRRVPLAALRRAPQAEAATRWVLERYAAAVDRLLSEPAPPSARQLTPAAVLGLPVGPRDDPELLRMRRELRAMLDAPVPAASSPLDLLRARGDREIRTRRLRELTQQLNARREALDRAAYAGLTSQAQGRLWLQHRLAHELLAAQWPAHSLRDGELSGLKLAADAAASVAVLAREDANRKSRAALRLALPLPALCRFGDGAGVFDCPRAVRGSHLELAPATRQASARQSIDAWREDARRRGLMALGTSGLAVRTGSRSAGKMAEELPPTLRRALFPDAQPCTLSHPSDCAGSWLNAAFERTLAPPSAWLGATAGRAAGSAESEVARAVSWLWREIDGIHGRASRLAHEGLRLHALLRAIGWLTLAFLAVKSFLYVLGLEAFRHRGPQTLGFEDAPGAQGEIRVGRRLSLDASYAGPLVTHRQLSNSDNRLRLAPWPGSAPIGRLLCGRYLWFTRGLFLSAGASAKEGLARIASADAGQAIVEWRMQPGEEVVFAWRDFFGASENLRFQTRLSLRLSTLLLGRVLFRIARCPAGGDRGVLLLRADVEQVDSSALHAVPPERLLAWNRQVRFRAHGADTAWGVLVHGVTLVREPEEGGIVVATSDDAGPRFGSLRFLRRLFTTIF